MREDYQDKIDNYLMNRMSAKNRMAFKQKVDSDSEIRDQFLFTEKVQNALKVRNERLAQMKEWENDYVWNEEREAAASSYKATGSGYDNYPTRKVASASSERKKKGLFQTKGRIYWISGVAAMLILGFFIVPSLFFNVGSPGLGQSFVDAGTLRSGSDYSDIELLIVQKQYEEALCAISDSSIALKRDSLVLLQDESIDEQKREYGQMIVAEKRDDLMWLKIQALLGCDRKPEALLLLDEMRQREGYYQLTADTLYVKVKK